MLTLKYTIEMNFSLLVLWLKQNPGFIPSITALSIACYTQWSLTRRTNRDLFIKKIEDLHVSLNQNSAANQKRFQAISNCYFENDLVSPLQLEKFACDIPEVYNRKIDEDLSMYINLYFRDLNSCYQNLVRAQNRFTTLIDNIATVDNLGNVQTPKLADFEEAYIECENSCEEIKQELLERISRVLRRTSLF